MNRRWAIVIAVISLAAAVAVGFFAKSTYENLIDTTMLPVPVVEIQPYTQLAAGMFEEREFPQGLANLPYYQSIQDLVGRMSTGNLGVGLPVPLSGAGLPAQVRLAGPEFEVVSLPIDPEAIIGGHVNIGDRVNLYLLRVIDLDDFGPSMPAATDPVTPTEPTGLDMFGDLLFSGPTEGASLPVFTVADIFSGTEIISDTHRLTIINNMMGFSELVVSGVEVVDLRTRRGTPTRGTQQATNQDPLVGDADSSANTRASEAGTIEIVSLALLPDDVIAVLDAMAETIGAGADLWLTLALP
jgi:hypothetical protein